MGTANIIGKDKGVLIATSVGVLPLVMALDFAACPGCIQRGCRQCEYASSCPVLAAWIVYESHPAPLLLDEAFTNP